MQSLHCWASLNKIDSSTKIGTDRCIEPSHRKNFFNLDISKSFNSSVKSKFVQIHKNRMMVLIAVTAKVVLTVKHSRID